MSAFRPKANSELMHGKVPRLISRLKGDASGGGELRTL
jgi:hypothetical protein